MTIQRQNGEIIIRLSDNIDLKSLQRLVDYIKYNETTINSIAEQNEIDKLSSEINKDWWQANKDRFIK